eukprot:GILJ01014173.1.p1 GENE.GILJ01014173.1~~GILJ01014173.1.p1  ORF type:complete len:273 (-),score=15.67 GILJ01014173.1:189-983(-)
MTDLESCAICFEDYDSSSHLPKRLPCGHVFCVSCLLRVNNLLCPVDRMPFDPYALLPVALPIPASRPAAVARPRPQAVTAAPSISFADDDDTQNDVEIAKLLQEEEDAAIRTAQVNSHLHHMIPPLQTVRPPLSATPPFMGGPSGAPYLPHHAPVGYPVPRLPPPPHPIPDRLGHQVHGSPYPAPAMPGNVPVYYFVAPGTQAHMYSTAYPPPPQCYYVPAEFNGRHNMPVSGSGWQAPNAININTQQPKKPSLWTRWSKKWTI